MALRLPVAVRVEYRGQQPATQFTNRTTGELVDVAPKFKFEYEDESGDVSIIPVGQNMLDRCSPPIDAQSFKKGDTMTLVGHCIMQERGSDRDSYFALTRVDLDASALKAA